MFKMEHFGAELEKSPSSIVNLEEVSFTVFQTLYCSWLCKSSNDCRLFHHHRLLTIMFIQIDLASMENSGSCGLAIDFFKMAQIGTIFLGPALYNPMFP